MHTLLPRTFQRCLLSAGWSAVQTSLRRGSLTFGSACDWLSARASGRAQADVAALRMRLGRAPTPARARPDVSQAGLLRVAQEGERLRAECARRAAEREALVGALRHVCLDLGEDAVAAAAEVHPALARGWCAPHD